MPVQFSLEILSGLHRGVSQVLVPGTYVIGSGDDADIVLSDPAIEGRHCELVLTDDDAQIAPLSGPVAINDEPISAKITLANQLSYVRLATVTLALEQTLAAPRNLRERVQRSVGNARQRLPNSYDTQTLLESSDPPRRGGRFLAITLLCLALVFVLVLVVTGGLRMPTSSGHLGDEIRAVLARNNVQPARVERGSSGPGSWLVTLYEGPEEQAGRFTTVRNKLQQMSEDIGVRVLSQQELVDMVRGVLTQMDATLTAQPGKAGEVVLSGRIGNASMLGQIADALRTDLPDLQSIDDEPAIIDEEAVTYLRQKLVDANLQPMPDISLSGDRVIARGPERLAQSAAWVTSAREFDRRYAPFLSAQFTNTQNTPVSAVPQIAVEGVWLGRQPYILVDGQPHFEGTVLDNGWSIEMIDEKGVLLKRGRETLMLEM